VSRYEQLATGTLDAQTRAAANVSVLRAQTASIEQILRTIEWGVWLWTTVTNAMCILGTGAERLVAGLCARVAPSRSPTHMGILGGSHSRRIAAH